MNTPSPTTPGETPGDALSEIVDALVAVIGDEFLLDVEVTPATTFGGDLGLESIEFVALAEQLTNRYEGRVDFTAFLAGLTIDEILSLTVGQLADHITASVHSLSNPLSNPLSTPLSNPISDPISHGTSIG